MDRKHVVKFWKCWGPKLKWGDKLSVAEGRGAKFLYLGTPQILYIVFKHQVSLGCTNCDHTYIWL